MKMKALCDKTGLTRKTVLYYEEQGFVTPQKTKLNGRDYRDYSEEDVERLQNIATLRKCSFSIEEIKRMHERPDEVLRILWELRDRLQKEQSELEELLQRISAITEGNVCDIPSLAHELCEAAKPLPLPEADLEPHFLYLDKLEEVLKEMDKPSKYHIDSKPVEIDQDHIIMDRRFGSKKLLDDIKEDLQEAPRYGVPEPSGGPIWLGILKGIAVLGLVMFFFDMMQASRWGITSKPFLVDMGIIAGLAAAIIGITAIQQRLRRK